MWILSWDAWIFKFLKIWIDISTWIPELALKIQLGKHSLVEWSGELGPNLWDFWWIALGTDIEVGDNGRIFGDFRHFLCAANCANIDWSLCWSRCFPQRKFWKMYKFFASKHTIFAAIGQWSEKGEEEWTMMSVSKWWCPRTMTITMTSRKTTSPVGRPSYRKFKNSAFSLGHGNFYGS